MATYIILSKLSPQAFTDPKQIRDLAATVRERIKAECPGVEWKESWATQGQYDVVDIVEADDPREVTRAALIIRGYGRARTETLPGLPWKEFLKGL